METGELETPLPEISSENVQRALKSLEYTTFSDDPNPLQHLDVVMEYLHLPETPYAPQRQAFEFKNWLLRLITETFIELQQRLDREPPQPNDSKAQALRQLHADFRSENPHLIAWSWLYYRYVRQDLNISRNEIYALNHYPARTLFRYQTRGIELLTEVIYARESAFRKTRRREWLLTKLPGHAQRIYGRKSVLRHLMRLRNESGVGVVQVYGPTGIGKTACVQTFLQKEITQNQIDYLIWINQPLSVDAIQRLICHELQVPIDRVAQLASRYRVTIVIDNLDCLWEQKEALAILLSHLRSVKVYLIGRKRWTAAQVDASIALKGLDYSATHKYLNYLRTLHLHETNELDPLDIEHIWQFNEGNPAQLKREFLALFFEED